MPDSRKDQSWARPTIHLVMAARPNFMKVAPLYHALTKTAFCKPVLVHTGQHYDDAMSGSFLRDLGMPPPDIHLGVGSGTHAEQTGGVMIAYERACTADRPEWVVVVGDVNSTAACAITAKKLDINVAHLEAGLRSFDRTMPEEINRLLTDSISDLLWTPSQDADANLIREGAEPEKIDRIGNIMIDSFEMQRTKIEELADQLPADEKGAAVVTLHRPSNVDNADSLRYFANTLVEISKRVSLFFPLHPRTLDRLKSANLLAALQKAPAIKLSQPLGYVEFLARVMKSRIVITDSGGLQEETTYLGIPCLTVRDNTERPITIKEGTNQLIKLPDLAQAVGTALDAPLACRRPPDRWDGRTAERAVASLARVMGLP